MFDIMTPYSESRADMVGKEIAAILHRDGMSVTVRALARNRCGGMIRLGRLMMRKASLEAHGIKSDESYIRLPFLLKRLMKLNKKYKGLQLFPISPATVKVRCFGRLHKIIVTDKGDMVLVDHPKETIAEDVALGVLAQKTKLPRCLELYFALKGTHSIIPKRVPPELKPLFNLVCIKRDVRARTTKYLEKFYATNKERYDLMACLWHYNKDLIRPDYANYGTAG